MNIEYIEDITRHISESKLDLIRPIYGNSNIDKDRMGKITHKRNEATEATVSKN